MKKQGKNSIEVKTIRKFLLESPQKIREVVYLIKGMSPLEAVERLPFINKKASQVIRKSIQTVVSNAKNLGLLESSLVFKEIQVNEGPRLKRFRAGSRGRAKPYKRRMSHLRIVVEGKKEEVVKEEK